MTKKPTSPKAKPDTWTPPPEWTANSDFGFAGALDGDGKPVDLVRISDLIRWLEEARRIPRSEAIQAVIDALPWNVMAWIYKITPGKRAALVDANATFGQPTAESIARAKAQRMQDPLQREFEARNSRTSWVGEFSGRFGGSPLRVAGGKIGVRGTDVVPVEPGRPALLQYLGKWVSVRPVRVSKGVQVDTLDSRDDILAYLAIPHAKAYALFGWCAVDVVEVVAPSVATEQPKTWAELVRYRKKTPGHAWTDGMRKILVAEEERRKAAGQTGVRKAMAGDLGSMTASGLGDQIRKAETGTKSGRGRKAA